MRLAGKRALVTGAGRGIGKAIARKFLAEGARVMMADVVADRLAQAAQELAPLGEVATQVCDVADRRQVQALVEATVGRFGGLDVAVNNAGIAYIEDFLDIPEEHWDRTMAVNLKGVFLVAQAAARVMVAQRSGVILNMASTNGILGEAQLAHYNAAKAGVILLTKTIAIELAPYGIRCNAVCPGFIRTDLVLESGGSEEFVREYIRKIPLGRYGTPEDVANVFAFLASDEAGFVTGESVVVDGGQIAQE